VCSVRIELEGRGLQKGADGITNTFPYGIEMYFTGLRSRRTERGQRCSRVWVHRVNTPYKITWILA